MTEPVRVAVCGLGSIGKAAARLLLQHRRGARVVAAATLTEPDIGRPLGAVLGLPPDESDGTPVVVGSAAELLRSGPDVVLLCTGSFLPDVADDVLAIVEAGASVVTPCEELAYPFRRDPGLAAKIDDAAVRRGVTVLGAGVNPGFVFDALLAAASAVSWDVTGVRGRRIVDVAGFGENIHRRLGIGYTPEEFEAGHADGTVAGHVGFPESIELLVERFGLELDGPVREEFVPMVATTGAPTTYGAVPAGRTEGFRQTATGLVGGRELVVLDLVLHLRPQEAGLVPQDAFEIEGLHPVRLQITPGADAIPATSAQLVNSIPGVLRARPGLKTVKDLPPAAAWLGDLRPTTLR